MNAGTRGGAVGRTLGVALAALLLAGCATGSNPRDPYESFNRPIFAFNDALDRNVLRPVASGYRRFTPEPLQFVLGNFFQNLGDLYIGANNLLQAKPGAALVDVTRFVVNSTLGIGGLADVATELGLKKNNEDFGQTLGWWGVPSGPYLMLPLLGPSTVRDTAGRFVDRYGDPLSQYHDVALRNTGLGLRIVDDRSRLLEADRLLEDAFDRYSLLRDGYLARRQNLVHDGDPPDEGQDDEDDDDFYADDPSKDDPPAAPAQAPAR